MAFQENSHKLCESSSFNYHFNDDINKTFDLSKCDNLLNPSRALKTILEPFNKLTSGCINKEKNIPVKLSEIESDESLGILPDLLGDEMPFDLCKTDLFLPDNALQNVFASEMDENPTSFVFSPPSDNQFNKISLFLKNVSTPLPNFVNDRRCSSTPKEFLSAGQLVLNTTNIIDHDSSSHSLDEKEEPIAGSCRIEFQTDINLDDLENVKPLTSTHKALSLPLTSLVLNRQTDFKSAVNFEKSSKSFENNLNVTQTFCNNSEDLFPCEHEDSIQNVDSLNNTFKIEPHVLIDTVVPFKHSIPNSLIISELKSNSCSKKENVKILDSTFVMPANEVICNENPENTFVLDFNSVVDAKESPKSIFKDIILNETKVLDSVEFSPKQQEQIANVTFTKELENDIQISLDNQFYLNSDMAFRPMAQILEETYSENDLRSMEVKMKDLHQCLSASSKEFKPNDTFSEKALFPELPLSTFYEEAVEKISENQINLSKKENDPTCNIELFNALQSAREIFSDNIHKRANKETKKFYKSHPVENNSLEEVVSSEVLSTTFSEEMERNSCFYNQNNILKNENISANKIYSDPLQLIGNSFSQKNNEKTNQDAKFLRRHSIPEENSNKLKSFKLPKESKCLTISNRSEESNLLKFNVFKNSNNSIKDSASISKTLSPLNQSGNCHNKRDSLVVIDNVFTSNAMEETFFSHSFVKEDCFLKIASNSLNECALTSFSEKTNQFPRANKPMSNDNSLVQLSQNSSKEMSIGTFPEKTSKDRRQLGLIPSKKDDSLKSSKIITNVLFKKSSDNIHVQSNVLLNENNRNSVVETKSSNLTKLGLKGTLSEKAADKHTLKSSSVESEPAVKRELMKPTNIVHPRMLSVPHLGHLRMTKPLSKPNTHKTQNFNRTLVLSDSSNNKSSKDLNRKLSLPCLSASDDSKSKSENGFKKPFEIPSKLGIKKPISSYQKSRLDSKYSNGLLKNTTLVKKQNLLIQPVLISDKDSTIVSSISSVYGKEQPVPSRLSVYEKLPIKSFKIKECGPRADTNASVNKITIHPKVIDLPLKEQKTDIKINTANLEQKSRHSFATGLPRNFPTSLSNIPNKGYTSKLPINKPLTTPAVISYKLDIVNEADSKKPPKSIYHKSSITQPKFSSQSKVLPQNISLVESKSAGDKVKSSGNQKMCVKTQISTGYKKEKDNKRESNNLDSSIRPTSSKQVVLPENASISRRTSGRLPQLRRIPAPRCNK